MKTRLFLIAAALGCASITHAGLLDKLGLGKSPARDSAERFTPLSGWLTQEQTIDGLKAALGQGVQQAVNSLGRNNGFLTNLAVKIPVPEQLRTVEKSLRFLKQDRMADDFVAAMNHAAEQAVPAAADVFAAAVRDLTIADAKSILGGATNSATLYFRRATESRLYDQFRPIVGRATDQAGVTSAYKQMLGKAGTAGSLGSLSRSLLGAESADLDDYITHRTLDGLFKVIGDEEARIRQNPAARTTALLQQVFGSVNR